ncbi:MAG: PIG-L family deacetylase [Bryobacteraceae bacterium]
MPTGIMAIAAHPGDGQFTMGAAVAQHIDSGGSGVFVSLSSGERGHPKIPPAEYGQMQRDAMLKAAAAVGAQAEFLPYADAEVPSGDTISLQVCDLIRKHKPAIVVTHWSGSWHKDHQHSFLVARDGIFYAGLAAIRRDLPPHNAGKLFYAENWEDAANYQADVYLDITPVYENWIRACAMFPMWRGETGFRYNDYYQGLAKCRGALAGSDYAVALMTDPEQRLKRVRSLDT